MEDFIIGFIISLIISFAGYLKKSLSLSGAAFAVILGTSVYYIGGVYFSAILVAFFLSSSILSRFNEALKGQREDVTEKGGKRDYSQVAANGLTGLTCAILFFITKDHVFILGYAAAFSAANSDTWASEIGVLSKRKPVSILIFKEIDNGMSGGISLLGTVASILGAGFIGVVFTAGYIIVYGFTSDWFILLFLCSLGGFSGSIADSIMGASVQAKYVCEICGKITEKRIHHGRETRLISGTGYINNEAVNLASTVIASAITMLIYIGFRV